MRRFIDIIIALGVIVGAISIGIGFRKVGAICILAAMLLGWKRDWAMDLFDGMMDSSENSAINHLHDSHCDDFGDSGHGGDADAGH